MDDRASPLTGPCLVAASFSAIVMVYEIALSRLFSVLVQDHLVFVAVSLAISGLGIGGLVTYLLAERGLSDRKGYLPLCATGMGVFLVIALLLLLHVYLPLERSRLLFLAALPPFVAGGMGLAALFLRFGAKASVLYAADLAGASLGALGSILLLTRLGGAIQTILAIAAFALAVGAVVAWFVRLRALSATAALLCSAVLALLAVNGEGRVLVVDYSRVGFDTYLGREIRKTGGQILETRWDAYSRIDVVAYPEFDYKREIYINAGTQANLWRFDGDVDAVAPLREKLEATAYGMGPSREVLNLGAGGGYDALVALLSGARHVTCIEVNPSVVRTALDSGRYSGDVFRYRNVDVRIDEARSFLARDPRRYDVIFSAVTSTLAFTDVREATFLESTVYTVEAFGAYLDHLEAGGRLAIIINREDLLDRLIVTLLAALEQRGVAPVDAMRRVLALHDPGPEAGAYAFLLVATPEPLPERTVATTVDSALARGFQVHFAPGIEAGSVGLRAIAAGRLGPGAFARDYPEYRIDPTTDDRPYFFQWERSPNRHLVSLLVNVAGIAAGYLLLFFVVSRRSSAGSEAAMDVRRLAAVTLFFTILGIGFMLLELTLLSLFNRFLGYPTLSLSMVLFTLLLAGGLGSFAGEALVRRTPQLMAGRMAVAVAVLALAFALCAEPLLDRWKALSIIGRVGVSVAALAPLGFLLGFPFPLGLRALREVAPAAIPWIWGWNGIASVLGSTIAVLCAMEIGLRGTLIAGAMLYALVPLAARGLAPSASGG